MQKTPCSNLTLGLFDGSTDSTPSSTSTMSTSVMADDAQRKSSHSDRRSFSDNPSTGNAGVVLVSHQILFCLPVSTGILGNSPLLPISVVSHFQSTLRHLLTSEDQLLGDCSSILF
jgi:hypothetical protein